MASVQAKWYRMVWFFSQTIIHSKFYKYYCIPVADCCTISSLRSILSSYSTSSLTQKSKPFFKTIGIYIDLLTVRNNAECMQKLGMTLPLFWKLKDLIFFTNNHCFSFIYPDPCNFIRPKPIMTTVWGLQ